MSLIVIKALVFNALACGEYDAFLPKQVSSASSAVKLLICNMIFRC